MATGGTAFAALVAEYAAAVQCQQHRVVSKVELGKKVDANDAHGSLFPVVLRRRGQSRLRWRRSHRLLRRRMSLSCIRAASRAEMDATSMCAASTAAAEGWELPSEID